MDFFKIAGKVINAGKVAGGFINQRMQEYSETLNSTYDDLSSRSSDELRRIKNNSFNSWTKRATAMKILKERGEE